ncbi:MAG: hypothetical protein HY918_01330 [Candidatus Doudnabacteria bacterium]|nr:hypothetical protein [Candidatus Doudnabacteria bacterium]
MTLNKKISLGVIILLLIVAGISVYFKYQKKDAAPEQTIKSSYKPNKIDVVDKTNLPAGEKDQVTKAVDDFMNQYKLPHSETQNAYVLQIEKRLNDALEVKTDPDKAKSDTNTTIYLRKTNNQWEVDKTAGPWCTLEEFEQNNCN